MPKTTNKKSAKKIPTKSPVKEKILPHLKIILQKYPTTAIMNTKSKFRIWVECTTNEDT